jgi:hypothetical protein
MQRELRHILEQEYGQASRTSFTGNSRLGSTPEGILDVIQKRCVGLYFSNYGTGAYAVGERLSELITCIHYALTETE